MEGITQNVNDDNNIKYDVSSTSITNWTIANGSLVNSVTFESSSSPIDDDDDDDNQKTDNNSTPKSPLILYPPSPDPSPCEITITFVQKHEVRQVYVRSTARVYEMYYAPKLQSSNEYLATVRCSVAIRDEEVLHTPTIEEAALTNPKGGSKELVETKSKSDNNFSTNEDGWVEVKALDTPQLDNGNETRLSVGSPQDLYEATAEINDADPCMSITLRLLSLQHKECVFVDEIYVFGDPVESSDSENQVGQIKNPASSSLMAMFMPTLLQLSKTRNADRVQDDNTFRTREKQKSEEVGSEVTDSTNFANKIQQEENSDLADKEREKLPETVGAAAIPVQVEMPPQVSDVESKSDLSCSRIEKVLEQLVSRVGRIEDIFLRFEERMLKPINSIEERLQQVEQQLGELSKKSQNSGLLSGTRISAPEFSCHSDDNFFSNNENNMSESGEKDCVFSIPPDNLADLVNADQSLSGLVITASEYSNADDEEENDALESRTGSPKNKPKQTLSVDDALASALAGFLSSTVASSQKYTQALAIRAPDFSADEDSNSGKRTPPEDKVGRVTDPPICFNATAETECVNDSVSPSSIISGLEREVKVMKSIDGDYEKMGEGMDDLCQQNDGGEDDTLDMGIHCRVGKRERNTSDIDDCKEALNQFVENETDNSDSSREGVIVNTEYQSTEDIKSVEVSSRLGSTCTIDECETADSPQEDLEEVSEKDVLKNVLEFSRASSLVDFEIPILDVKFVSQENSNTKSFLEALLTDMPESNVETPRSKESDAGSQVGQQCNLISVDEEESSASPAIGNHFSLDMDYCSIGEMPVNVEDEKLQDHYTCNNGVSAASLI